MLKSIFLSQKNDHFERILFNIHDVNTWKENLSKKKEKLKLS